MMKRFASHYLLIPGVGFVKQQVVEISDEGVAQNIFPLNEEVESVEWLPGLIVLLSVHQMEEIRNTGMVVKNIPVFPTESSCSYSCVFLYFERLS